MRTRSLLVVSLLGAFACQSNQKSSPEIAADSSSATTTQASEAVAFDSNARASDPSAAPLVEAAQQEEFRNEEDRLKVIREKQRYLAEQYIRLGDERLDRADLEGALREYAQALEVMPGNEQAQAGLRRVQALLGDDFAQAAEGIEDAYQQAVVRRTQARLEAEQHMLRGDELLKEGAFDDAVTSYRQALSILQFHPLISDDSLDEVVLRGSAD